MGERPHSYSRINVVTKMYLLGEVMHEFQAVIMLFSRTYGVEEELWPIPRCSYSFQHNICNPGSIQRKDTNY